MSVGRDLSVVDGNGRLPGRLGECGRGGGVVVGGCTSRGIPGLRVRGCRSLAGAAVADEFGLVEPDDRPRGLITVTRVAPGSGGDDCASPRAHPGLRYSRGDSGFGHTRSWTCASPNAALSSSHSASNGRSYPERRQAPAPTPPSTPSPRSVLSNPRMARFSITKAQVRDLRGWRNGHYSAVS